MNTWKIKFDNILIEEEGNIANEFNDFFCKKITDESNDKKDFLPVILHNVKSFIPKNVLMTLYKSLVQPHLQYV